MARRNLKKREAIIALLPLFKEHKYVTNQIAKRRLIEIGYFSTVEELAEQMMLEQTRELLKEAKYYRDDNDQQILLVNLFKLEGIEEIEEGEGVEGPGGEKKFNYWRNAHETTIDEDIQNLNYWKDTVVSDVATLRMFYELACKRHGKRQIQRRFQFDFGPFGGDNVP